MTGGERSFVMGGASVYRMAINMVDRLFITHVHTVIDADVFFPEIDPKIWARENTSETHTDPETGYSFEFVEYIRK